MNKVFIVEATTNNEDFIETSIQKIFTSIEKAIDFINYKVVDSIMRQDYTIKEDGEGLELKEILNNSTKEEVISLLERWFDGPKCVKHDSFYSVKYDLKGIEYYRETRGFKVF